MSTVLRMYGTAAAGRCPRCDQPLSDGSNDARIVCTRCETILYVTLVQLTVQGED